MSNFFLVVERTCPSGTSEMKTNSLGLICLSQVPGPLLSPLLYCTRCGVIYLNETLYYSESNNFHCHPYNSNFRCNNQRCKRSQTFILYSKKSAITHLNKLSGKSYSFKFFPKARVIVI